MARKNSQVRATRKKGKTGSQSAKAQAEAAKNAGTPPAPVTAFQLTSARLENDLLTGNSPGLLQDYFGPEAYEELRDMARNAAARSVHGGPRVLVLPGIMGSTLSKKGLLGIDDVLWVNPVEIALGRLPSLKLDSAASPYYADGVILLAYLKLKLRLKIAGFDAHFYPYDWRMPLPDLGKELAKTLEGEGKQVALVAHSMGGLVARAALASGANNIGRLIMLGTPNYGSFAPAQALRGTYDVVKKICMVDRFHTPEQLAGQVFNTFPGLYQMLPSPDKYTSLDLLDKNSWPKQGPRPRADLLAGVKAALAQLSPAYPNFYLIAGVNQPTVVGLQVQGDEFAYTLSPDGDGTVPLAFAELANIPSGQTYFVEESHGSLPNNGSVEDAVVDLLAKGSTTVLTTTRPAPSRTTHIVSEAELQQMAREAPGIGQLGTSDYRHLLDAVAAPPSAARVTVTGAMAASAGLAAEAGATPVSQQFQGLVVGRRRQRRLELTLAHGSITEADSRAYVLGVFRNVVPSGAASAIDGMLDGVISEFTARRLFSGDVGEVFTLPTNGSRLKADMVLFAGLGPFDHFTTDVQQLIAENIIRVLVRSRVDEFATVLIGAGSGQSAGTVMQNLLIGFFRGLQDADQRHRFRGITLCESDASKYNDMKAALFRLAGTALFNDIEVTLNETELPPPAEAPAARVLSTGPEPVYAIVRQEDEADNLLHISASILGAGMKAAVVTGRIQADAKAVTALLKKLDDDANAGRDLTDLGQRFAGLLLPSEVCTVLTSMKDRHLVVVHDGAMSRIPWELLTIKGWSFSVENGLSRRYLADNLPIATWMEQRRAEPTLKLLLVVNPLGDLAGADKEGARIQQLAKSEASIQVTPLYGPEATRAAIVAQLRTGVFDVVHYAGHAFFDPNAPGRSGLRCANNEVLTGADLRGISSLPFLVFFNACEAGRVRKVEPPARVAPSHRLQSSFSVADTLMRGGISNYLSTYWPVGDAAAENFAGTFYEQILLGEPIGSALLKGRQVVRDKVKSPDWADYILYGSYDFILKQPRRGR